MEIGLKRIKGEEIISKRINNFPIIVMVKEEGKGAAK